MEHRHLLQYYLDSVRWLELLFYHVSEEQVLLGCTDCWYTGGISTTCTHTSPNKPEDNE